MKWQPDDFTLEMTSVWSFPQRGKWATHDGKYRGNWSPYIPRNLILRYSGEGDRILDCFVGGGTTLVEAKLLNRNCIGIDINEKALERCREKCDFSCSNMGKIYLKQGDARNLHFIKDESIDFICTHPPYANIIQYSQDIEQDLSRLDVDLFLEEMNKVVRECYRVLKKRKILCDFNGGYSEKGTRYSIEFFCYGFIFTARIFFKRNDYKRTA